MHVRLWSAAVLTLLFVSHGGASAEEEQREHVRAHLFVNGAEGAAIPAGEPAVVEVSFALERDGEEASEAVTDFKPVMGKFMHFVAIKRDLSEFAHFHPLFDPQSGLFQVPIHLPMVNPDNADAAFAMPTPCDYLIYVEAVSEERGMIIRGLDYRTADQGEEQPLIVSEPVAGVYYVYMTGQNTVGSPGDLYRADIRFDTVPGQGGDLIQISVTLNMLNRAHEYEQVAVLEPWLMMGGHAILVGASGHGTADKTFAHFHAELPPEGGELLYSYFARGGMAEGDYKVWFQLQHQGLILKVPLAFRYSRP